MLLLAKYSFSIEFDGAQDVDCDALCGELDDIMPDLEAEFCNQIANLAHEHGVKLVANVTES